MAKFVDEGGLTDQDVSVELSSERVVPQHDRFAEQMSLVVGGSDEEREAATEANRIPDRPADNAAHAKWVDYCVALGAQRGDLEYETVHYVSGTGIDAPPNPAPTYTSPAYETAELKELANRLGG